MGADLSIYRKWKQCWASAPVWCLLNLKERELNLKRSYNIAVWFLLWEFCIQVPVNVCKSESIFSCCQVREFDAWSNWMTNKATAKKHLSKCCEAAGRTELSPLCCNVWLFPWGIPKPWPWPSQRMAEGSIRSCAGSQGWRAQAKTGLKYPCDWLRGDLCSQGWNIHPCDWLRGDPCSQLLFICMPVFNASQHFSQKLYNDGALKYSHLVTSEQWDTTPCHCCPDDLCFSLQQYNNKIRVWRRKMTDESRRLPAVWYDKVPCSVWIYKPFTSVESYLVHSH